MPEIDYSQYYWKNSLIRLRPPKEDDWEELIHNMFDSTARFLYEEQIELPVSVEAYKQRHTDRINAEKQGYTCFAIENSEGRHVGIANLFHVDERNGTFGPISLQINPADRHKGYGSAALRLLGNYMFNERRMHKWNSCYVEGNKDSEALHKKIGFVIEGVQRDMFFHNGKHWNKVLCGMTREQFLEAEQHLPPLI